MKNFDVVLEISEREDILVVVNMNRLSSQQEGNNASLQADEIEALSSIYGKEWNVDIVSENSYSIDIGADPTRSVHLKVALPPDYPLQSPPVYQFSAPWMTRKAKNILSADLEEINCCHAGENIIYLWIEKVREFVEKFSVESPEEPSKILASYEDPVFSATLLEMNTKDNCDDEELPPIEHGEPIVDRLSVFQAHLSPVVTVDQVNSVLSKLKENRKIASATHNIFAYRIFREPQKAFIQDCEDDGENKAGSVLLHLLQILNASNVLVVVSRWYGGIHLGSDRFKHINNAARSLLDQCGYIANKKTPSKKTKKRK